MVTRRLLRWTARIVAGVLLCVQGAFAFGSCGMPIREPARVIADMNLPACHEPEVKVEGLCVLHCLSDQQSLDKPDLKPAAVADAPMLLVAERRPPISTELVVWKSPALHAPPARILFRSLLI